MLANTLYTEGDSALSFSTLIIPNSGLGTLRAYPVLVRFGLCKQIWIYWCLGETHPHWQQKKTKIMAVTIYGGFSMCQTLCQLDTLSTVSHLILTTTPSSMYYYCYCHHIDEKLKVRAGKCWHWNCNSRASDSRSCALLHPTICLLTITAAICWTLTHTPCLTTGGLYVSSHHIRR